MGDTEPQNSTRRALVTVGAIWLVSTVLVELAAANWTLHPFGASREAGITDDAFDLLLYLAIPVFTFVLVVLGYSFVRYRTQAEDHTDGPPVRTHRMFIGAWLVVTTALSVLVIITPGFTGLDELRAEPEPDLIIDVKGERWSWIYTYAESGVETQGALVLPVDTRVLFRITSTDVIHSFWIPAFRIKQDAVPGRVTSTLVTAEEIGTFTEEKGMRVQCAELCGVGHARMWTEVTVMSQVDFDAWLVAAGG